MTIGNNAEEIYSRILPKSYDTMQRHMVKYKKIAVEKSRIQAGDSVVVFCCGSGMDFHTLEERIGPKGNITGIDFSKQMLHVAKNRIIENGWANITLIQMDVAKTGPINSMTNKFDAGICTLGLSIIPSYRQAYQNLKDCVKQGGQIIIGDMQIASGIYSLFNPLSVYFSRPFGGSYAGHKASKTIKNEMLKSLENVYIKYFLFHSYFICWGTKLY
jgi:ubiquinone/menaquinone biosynthesis C-methylase UbiE